MTGGLIREPAVSRDNNGSEYPEGPAGSRSPQTGPRSTGEDFTGKFPRALRGGCPDIMIRTRTHTVRGAQPSNPAGNSSQSRREGHRRPFRRVLEFVSIAWQVGRADIRQANRIAGPFPGAATPHTQSHANVVPQPITSPRTPSFTNLASF